MKLVRSSIKFISITNFDEIPLLALLIEANSNMIVREFSFQSFQVQQPDNGPLPKIVFSVGTFLGSDSTVGIKQLSIEERKIVIDLEGTSSDALVLYNKLTNILQQLVNAPIHDGFLKPIIETFESEIVAELDFHIAELVDDKLYKFLDERLLPIATTNYGKPRLRLDFLVFRLDYQTLDEDLQDYRISLSPKEFTIAPRPGQTLEKRIFVSKAPVPTDTHLQLLSELEAVYK